MKTKTAIALIAILLLAACNPWRAYRRTPHVTVDVRVPLFQHLKLDNGLSLYGITDTYVPLVRIRIAFRAGASSTPPGKKGSMLLLYEYLQNSKRRILENFDTLGTSPGFLVDTNDTAVEVVVNASDTPKAMELLADMLRKPEFEAARFEQIKKRRIAQIQNTLNMPSEIGGLALLKSIYGDGHPLSVSGRELLAEMNGLKVEDLYHAYEEFVGPENTAVIMAGSISELQMRALCRKYFGDWKASALEAPALLSPQLRLRSSILAIEKPGLQRTYISFGGLGIGAGSDEEYPLRIANQALSGHISGQLQRKGIPCTNGFQMNAMRGTGHFILTCDVKKEKTWEALDEIMSTIFLTQMEDFRGGRMPLLRSNQIWTMIGPFQSLSGAISQLSELFWQHLPDDFYIRSIDTIKQVNKEEAELALHKYFDRDRIHIVLVGDPSVFTNKSSTRFGPIQLISP